MSVQIRPVESKKDLNLFIDIPFQMHGQDPNWVPPLRIAVRDVLDPKKNPFYKHAISKLWIAFKNNKPVGRIVGTIDDTNNSFHSEKTAFWGFYESVNDQEVTNALFETVEKWAKEKGMNNIRGPMNPSTNHECGLQIDAFDTKPYIMMTQNPEYYPQLVEGAGNRKAKDLNAWIVDSAKGNFHEKLNKRAQDLEKNPDIKFRTVQMKYFEQEIEKILDVYNDAWEKNWGFVPMTDEEFRHMAKDMKQIVDPRLLYIVEVKGETAGFGLCLPDVNQVFVKVRDGKLFPTGLLKLLWNTKVNKKTINQGRILTLGVKKKYQPLGLASMMYLRYLTEAPKIGYPKAECSWVLEDNGPMNAGLKYMNGDLYKRYRIYDKPIP